MATAFSSRPASRSASAGLRGAGEQQLQGLLASKESEAVLLRQQLAQLTADFKFNLKVWLVAAIWWQQESGLDAARHMLGSNVS